MAARKSRLYLNSFLPVHRTHDEIVRNIFRPGKFACTITANLQLVGIACLCANVLVVVVSDYCHYHPCQRKLNIGTAVATICNASALYFIFCCGYVVGNPSLWVRINIVSNLTLATITIVAQSLAMKACLTVKDVHKSPGPMAIVGGSCLLLSCFSLFLLYRYKELDVQLDNIVKERKISEDKGSSVVVQRKVSITTRQEDGRKRSSERSNIHPHLYPSHIKAQIYVKHDDDKRKCSECSHDGSQCGVHVPKRKLSIYAMHDDHYHLKRKTSFEVYVNPACQQDDCYPNCSKTRKSSFYTKHDQPTNVPIV